jgi:hypothetical protein
MNRQRVKFSVQFPDYDRTEDVWVGGRVDALSGVEAIERAAKRAWESWLWECSSDFPRLRSIRAIATDPDGREWSGVVSLIPMPAFAVELEEAE